jgi:hypothetical protein
VAAEGNELRDRATAIVDVILASLDDPVTGADPIEWKRQAA